MKYTLIACMLAASYILNAEDTCSLMMGEENDPEEIVTVKGEGVSFCCSTCKKVFSENKAYYIKAIPKLYSKFTQVQLTELGVDNVKLLDQRTCPVYPDRVINPNSPTVDYKGITIYLWSSSAVRRWNKDPERYFKNYSVYI